VTGYSVDIFINATVAEFLHAPFDVMAGYRYSRGKQTYARCVIMWAIEHKLLYRLS